MRRSNPQRFIKRRGVFVCECEPRRLNSSSGDGPCGGAVGELRSNCHAGGDNRSKGVAQVKKLAIRALSVAPPGDGNDTFDRIRWFLHPLISGVPPGQRTILDSCRNLRPYLSGRQCGPSGPRSLRGADAGHLVTGAAEISKIIERTSAEKPNR